MMLYHYQLKHTAPFETPLIINVYAVYADAEWHEKNG